MKERFLNQPLDLNVESWDLFSQSHDEYINDWETDADAVPAENVDPSTLNAFEVKS